MFRSYIAGVGHYVPDRVVTNEDLSALMDTSDRWIRERTGIAQRRFVESSSGDCTYAMGVKAARQAIAQAGMRPQDIDFIVFATLSPDYYFPGSGVLVQEALGMDTVGALDVRNQCSGFLYALSVGDQFIKTGMYERILVIGSENHSGGLDLSTRGRGVSVVFGDGAGAVVLARSEASESGLLSTHLHAQGAFAEELMVKAPSTNGKWVAHLIEERDPDDTSYYPYMNGNYVFKHAVTRFVEVIREALQAHGKSEADLDLLIPHQANLRISQHVQQVLGLSDEQVFNNIQHYGNTTAASIPIALSEAVEQRRVEQGDCVCLAAFGSGFTWASALLKW